MPKVYARCNDDGMVEHIFSEVFEATEETDHLLKEGEGDEYVHVQSQYQLYDQWGRHNYIWDEETGGMRELTEEEKPSKPEPQPSEVEVLRQQVELMRKQIEILTGGAE